MRELTQHKIEGLNDSINIIVMDGPGPGGACHEYRIEPIADDHPQGAINPCDIHFQNGPIAENGVNGISNEALLAVVIDRLEGFQSGDFACEENRYALHYIEQALGTLHRRTRDRLIGGPLSAHDQRGVEGTNEK